VEEELHLFLTSTLYSDEWTAHSLGCFTAGERAQITQAVKAGWAVGTDWKREQFFALARKCSTVRWLL